MQLKVKLNYEVKLDKIKFYLKLINITNLNEKLRNKEIDLLAYLILNENKLINSEVRVKLKEEFNLSSSNLSNYLNSLKQLSLINQLDDLNMELNKMLFLNYDELTYLIS